MKQAKDYFPDNLKLSYLLEVMQNHAQNNQLLISFRDKVFQVLRDDYYPDENGLIVLKRNTKWVENGFSVAELREILEKYHEKIKNILFEVDVNENYPLINMYESSDYSGVVYYTNIRVGTEADANEANFKPLNLPNNPYIRKIL